MRDGRKSADFLHYIERLKASTALPDIVSETLPLRRRGRVSIGLCPFHGDQSPSLYVYADHFHCFGCGAHGDVFDWLRRERGLSLPHAVQFLGGDAHIASGATVRPDIEQERARRRVENAARAAAGQARQIAEAERFWRRSKPAPGTIAEHYLRVTRGIPMDANQWPDAVRFLDVPSLDVMEEGPTGEDIRRTYPTAGALILSATAPNGSLRAVQRVYLDREGGNLRRGDGKKIKLTAGTFAGGDVVVRLPGAPGAPLLIAEGPETGLALWCASGLETCVSLGSVAGVTLPIGRQIVACRDDDKKFSPADRGFDKAVEKWRGAGVSFAIATPWRERRQDRTDFNDTLREGGIAAVRARIAAALDPGTPRGGGRKPLAEAHATLAQAMDRFGRAVAAHDAAVGQAKAAAQVQAAQEMPAEVAEAAAARDAYRAAKLAHTDATAMRAAVVGATRDNPGRRDSKEERAAARVELHAAMRGEADALAAYRLVTARLDAVLADVHRVRKAEAAAVKDACDAIVPPVHGIKVGVGGGKSLRARDLAAEVLVKMRAVGDERGIAFLVPMHRLGDAQAAEFEAIPAAMVAGLRARVWRGREAPDPDAPGHLMCRNIEAVRDAQAAMVPVQSAVCSRKIKGADGEAQRVECPFIAECGYQRQRGAKADLWIAAHELAFGEKPAAFGRLAAVVVDESPWQDGLEGVAGAPITLALDALRAVDAVPADPLATDRLAYLRNIAADALDELSDGPILGDALAGVGLTAQNAAEAFALEWRRFVDPEMHPGMSREERRAAAEAAAGNRTIRRFGMFWNALRALLEDGGPALSGWAELAERVTDDGAVRVVRLKGRRAVREGWQVPTLLIDAILNIALVRPFWPQVELTAEIAIDAPHQRVRQVGDFTFSKRRLLAGEETGEVEGRRRGRNMRDLHATLAAYGRAHAPGGVLVVAQMDVEAALPACGPLPRNIVTAHHNAVAGRDEWRDVAALVVVGRTAPPPADVERIAEALTGDAVDKLPGWYPTVLLPREMASGEVVMAEADRHPHPIAEAVRSSICEGELIQIIGRGRGVNRTAADPLDVLVMTNTLLPLPVAEMVKAADLDPGAAELMLAAGGIAFANPADAAAAYPSIWGNREAAKKAFQRGRWGQTRIDNTYNSGLSPSGALRRVDYQRRGERLSPASALFDPAIIPDIEAELVRLLGPLASCCVALSPDPHTAEEAETPVENQLAESGGPAELADPSLTYASGCMMPPITDAWTRPGSAVSALRSCRPSRPSNGRSRPMMDCRCSFRSISGIYRAGDGGVVACTGCDTEEFGC